MVYDTSQLVSLLAVFVSYVENEQIGTKSMAYADGVDVYSAGYPRAGKVRIELSTISPKSSRYEPRTARMATPPCTRGIFHLDGGR